MYLALDTKLHSSCICILYIELFILPNNICPLALILALRGATTCSHGTRLWLPQSLLQTKEPTLETAGLRPSNGSWVHPISLSTWSTLQLYFLVSQDFSVVAETWIVLPESLSEGPSPSGPNRLSLVTCSKMQSKRQVVVKGNKGALTLAMPARKDMEV